LQSKKTPSIEGNLLNLTNDEAKVVLRSRKSKANPFGSNQFREIFRKKGDSIAGRLLYEHAGPLINWKSFGSNRDDQNATKILYSA